MTTYGSAGGDGTTGDGGAGTGTAEKARESTGPTLTHAQCVNRLRDIREQMGQLAQLEHPSEEDDRYFRELHDEFEQVDGHRKKLERDATLAAVKTTTENLSTSGFLRTERGAFRGRTNSQDGARDYDVDPLLNPDSVEDHRFRNPWAIDEMRTYGRNPDAIASEFRSRAISACEKMQGCSPEIRKAATTLIERWDDTDARLSQLVLGISAPAYYRAFSKQARTEGNAHDLTEEERQAIARVRYLQRALSLTDAAGGYLVPFQLDPTLIIAANGSINQIRQVARQVVATGDVWNGVSAGAVQWQYTAEAAPAVDRAPTLAQPRIDIFKAQGFVPISMEALADASNIAAEVGGLLAFGRDVLEANAFAVGTGSAMPTGIVTALAGSPSVVTAASDTALAIGDVYKLQGALPARYRNQPSTAWLGNNLIYNMIRGFGTDVWGSLADGRQPTLLGRPVLESEDMDGTISAGVDNVLIHGDFSNYVIADRVGMTIEFIPHLFQQAVAGAGVGTPTGQRGWLAYVRHGADSVNDAAFRMLNVGV
jgi:HK97 family phage major capsid protein